MTDWVKGRSFKKLLIGTLAYLLVVIVAAQPVEELYQSANKLYKSGQLEQAAEAYQKIILQGYKTPEVYYNLGNCYYKLNNISGSILSYERAQKLAPRDEDIRHNLQMANARIVDKIIPVPQLGIITMWNNFVASNSSKGWGIVALVLIWLSLMLLAVYLFIFHNRALVTSGIILFVLSVAVVGLAFKQNANEQDSNAAILTVSNAIIKSAPDEHGNDLYMLHEGVKLQVLDKVGEWYKISLADGKVGWIGKGTFEKI